MVIGHYGLVAQGEGVMDADGDDLCCDLSWPENFANQMKTNFSP